MDQPVSAGVVANLSKPDAVPRTQDTVQRLREQGAEVFIESATASAIGETGGLSLLEVAERSEVIVVLGGDGTILHTARQLGPLVKPLAAVNTGRLGFLTTAMEEELDVFTSALVKRDYKLSRRSLIEVEFKSPDGWNHALVGLNEVSLTRGANSRMIRLETLINGESLNRFSGDGLIVATPTGSTAYSLSAGGPLVNPEAGVFVITPICPHALANRSFVVNDDVKVDVLPEEDDRSDILVTVDGGAGYPLMKKSTVRLCRAQYTVPLVRLRGVSFYTVLQQKLRWMGSNV